MKEIEFINCYSFFGDLVQIISKKQKLPFKKINMLGGRSSGKTFATLVFLSVLAMIPAAGNAIYVFRRTAADSKNLFRDFIERLKDFDLLQEAYINNSDRYIAINGWHITFATLNETTSKNKVGFRLWTKANYIIAFFEECSELNYNLVKSAEQSLRGNKDLQVLSIYASNPWTSDHWFVKHFNQHLEEDEINIQQDPYYEFDYDQETKELFLRTTYRANPFTNPADIIEFEKWKNIDYSKYRVISLGLSGSVEGAIYARALQNLIEPFYNGEHFYGGMDWGDGTSSHASDTVCLVGTIDQAEGIDILEEFVYNNSIKPLNTEQQIEMIVNWYIEQYKKYQRPFTIFIDNASNRFFYNTFNSIFQRIALQHGLYGNELVFAPATKHPIWDRVTLVNYMLSAKKIRFDKNVCKDLYNSLKNCYTVLPNKIVEDFNKHRSHEYTHSINAMEYLMSHWHNFFYNQISFIDEKGANRYV